MTLLVINYLTNDHLEDVTSDDVTVWQLSLTNDCLIKKRLTNGRLINDPLMNYRLTIYHLEDVTSDNWPPDN